MKQEIISFRLLEIKTDVILCNVFEDLWILCLPVKQVKDSKDSLKDSLLQVCLERDVQKELEEFVQNLFMEEYDLIQIPASLNVMYNFFNCLLGCVVFNLKQLIDSSIMSELT